MHVFLDESERGRIYLLCAALVHPSELIVARKVLRDLRRPGQRRVHMAKEQDSRRREILSAVVGLGVRARVYVCENKPVAARSMLLPQLVADLDDVGARLLVLESQYDNGQDHRDRLIIGETLRGGRGPIGLVYEHRRSYEEPLLALADVVAWAYGAGGDWRRRVEPVLDKVADLQK